MNQSLQEDIPIEEVFESLKCTREGLSSDAVQERLGIFGFNKLEEKKVGQGRRSSDIPNHFYTLLFLQCLFLHFHFTSLQESKILKFLGFMWNPLSWVMEAAAIMAIALAHGGTDIRGVVSNT